MALDVKRLPSAVAIGDVSKRFGRTLALDGVSLTVERGQSFALLGPNGAGKSTLGDIVCTLLKPDSGRVEIAGVDALKFPKEARRRLGVVFQRATLDTRLSVRENLRFHGLIYHMRIGEIGRRIDEVLAVMGMAEHRDTPVRVLSAGMRRRVEIARALLHGPAILFLDEPSVGLDTQSRAAIWRHINDLRATFGLTVLVTTHYIEEVEDCDWGCIIDHGKVLAQGTPTGLKHAHGKTTLRITPRTDAVAQEIRERYAIKHSSGDHMRIALTSPEDAETVLEQFGSQLTEFVLEQPSLESVFLALTGRTLQAPASGGRV